MPPKKMDTEISGTEERVQRKEEPLSLVELMAKKNGSREWFQEKRRDVESSGAKDKLQSAIDNEEWFQNNGDEWYEKFQEESRRKELERNDHTQRKAQPRKKDCEDLKAKVSMKGKM